MSSRELIGLRDLVLLDGNVHFRINGFTKAPSQDKVTLLVEGGTVTFGEDGIVDATGSVIDSFYAVLGSGDDDDSQRKLYQAGGLCEWGCYKNYIDDSDDSYEWCVDNFCGGWKDKPEPLPI